MSLCSGCFVSKWHLSLLGFKLSQACTLRQTTHCCLSSSPTAVQVKPKARYALSYFIVFGLEANLMMRHPRQNPSIMLARPKHSFFFLYSYQPPTPIAHCYYVFPTVRGKCNDSFSFVFLDYLGHNFNVKVLKRVVKNRCAWNVIFLWLNKWIRLQLCRKSETKHKVVRKQEYTKRNLQAFYSEHRNCFDIENR